MAYVWGNGGMQSDCWSTPRIPVSPFPIHGNTMIMDKIRKEIRKKPPLIMMLAGDIAVTN